MPPFAFGPCLVKLIFAITARFMENGVLFILCKVRNFDFKQLHAFHTQQLQRTIPRNIFNTPPLPVMTAPYTALASLHTTLVLVLNVPCQVFHK